TEFHREVGVEQEFNVHLELARFQEAQSNYEAAVAEYQKAVDVCERKGGPRGRAKIGPEQQSVAYRRMAASLDRMGRFAQAEPHHLKALNLAPRDPKVWNDAGYSYYLQNRLADAERTLRTAESLDKNNPRILTNLGLTLAAASKDDEALAALTRAGGPAAGHANLGYILAALGKNDQAREHYRKSLSLQPELAAARQALARLDAPVPATPTAIASSARPSAVAPSLPRLPVAATPSPGPVKDSQLTLTSATSTEPGPPRAETPPSPRKPVSVLKNRKPSSLPLERVPGPRPPGPEPPGNLSFETAGHVRAESPDRPGGGGHLPRPLPGPRGDRTGPAPGLGRAAQDPDRPRGRQEAVGEGQGEDAAPDRDVALADRPLRHPALRQGEPLEHHQPGAAG
ncbi:MAG: tetratricopeptide repeat protein, partial [Planctomycetia bacterium]|nr:tetratricopeptide repeat protein [Planctomycetia bacterium]